ncbi:MAG TPA: selenocysteine-specific translation elongation factor [Syntrophorhabdaceae bacterium]|nr:selenocysteine-specific translation elongation factor [Syntrophorhabdaceae bacterium]
MNNLEKNIVVGTAGHVDHGKTTLVKCLTGIDTDRLKEEKESGMTIEPGFAHLVLPNKTAVSIVDVPGHERFIKNMLRGISGVDIGILVIAADDGVMPQTVEHLDILSLLDIQQGLIVISKIDLVDEDLIQMVSDEIHELTEGTFLENAPIIPFSAKTGQGINKILKIIDDMAKKIVKNDSNDIFRLPIDRIFTMSGYGTIVTGTIASGKIKTGDSVEVYPLCKTTIVRNIQIHNKWIDEAIKGHRVGINISNIKVDELKRGMVLANLDSMQPAHIINAQFHYLNSNPRAILDKIKVKLYSGTSEVVGRMFFINKKKIGPGETCYVQLRLEEKIASFPYDRYVIRTLSPKKTIGGGIILEINPKKYKTSHSGLVEHLLSVEKRNIRKIIENLMMQDKYRTIDVSELVKKTYASKEEIKDVLNVMVKEGLAKFINDDSIILKEHYNALKVDILERISEFHSQHPHIKDISQEDIRSKVSLVFNQRLYKAIIKELAEEEKIEINQSRIKLSGFKTSLSENQKRLCKYIDNICRDYYFRPLPLNILANIKKRFGEQEIETVLKTMVNEKRLIRLNNNRLIHSNAMEDIKAKLRDYIGKKGKVTLSEFVDVIGIGRTQLQPIFDYLDAERFTMRIGDYRVLYKDVSYANKGTKNNEVYGLNIENKNKR